MFRSHYATEVCKCPDIFLKRRKPEAIKKNGTGIEYSASNNSLINVELKDNSGRVWIATTTIAITNFITSNMLYSF